MFLDVHGVTALPLLVYLARNRQNFNSEYVSYFRFIVLINVTLYPSDIGNDLSLAASIAKEF